MTGEFQSQVSVTSCNGQIMGLLSDWLVMWNYLSVFTVGIVVAIMLFVFGVGTFSFVLLMYFSIC